jgi:hypothetical protein
MRIKQQDKKLLSSPEEQLGSATNLYSFTLLLVLIICLSYLGNRLVSKWDGHFHDTKGCTTLQGYHGKIFKVNSCDNTIVNIGSVPDTDKKIPENPYNALPAEIKPLPTNKLPPPQKTEPAPSKTSPYMI